MPNLVGAALSVLQLGLRFGYGVKPANSDLGAPQRSINSPLYVDADGCVRRAGAWPTRRRPYWKSKPVQHRSGSVIVQAPPRV